MEDTYKMPKRVTIEEADNGYTVSCYDGKGEKKLVYESIDGAFQGIAKMMGMEMKKEKAPKKERIRALVKKLKGNSK